MDVSGRAVVHRAALVSRHRDTNSERYPPLAVQRCWETALTGDTAGAQRWAAVVDGAASSEDAPLDGSASLPRPGPWSGRAGVRAAPGRCWPTRPSRSPKSPRGAHGAAPRCGLLGEAHLLAGHPDQARPLFAERPQPLSRGATSTRSSSVNPSSPGWPWTAASGRRRPSGSSSSLPRSIEHRMHDYVFSIPGFAAAARLSLHHNDLSEAHRHLARAMRARPSATYALPCHAVRLRLQLANVYTALADVATARQLLREIDDILRHRPGARDPHRRGRRGPPRPHPQREPRSGRPVAAHPGRAAAASLPANTPDRRPDRRPAAPLQPHGQGPGPIDLPQAGRILTQRRHTTSNSDRLVRRLADGTAQTSVANAVDPVTPPVPRPPARHQQTS